MKSQKIGIASDHAATETRIKIVDFLTVKGLSFEDFGHHEPKGVSVDYPDYAGPLASAISSGSVAKGIALCGTGIGMAIAANKFPGVRAAPIWDSSSCQLSREHNDLNCLCLGVRSLELSQLLSLIAIWLETPFSAGRHLRRLAKLEEIEFQNFENKSKELLR